MTGPEANINKPEQSKLSAEHYSLAIELSVAVISEMSTTRVSDNISSALEYVRSAAKHNDTEPDAGVAAVLGVSMGAVNNDLSKWSMAQKMSSQLFKELATTSISDEAQAQYRSMMSALNEQPGDLGLLTNIVGGGMTYADSKVVEGDDMTPFKTLIFATGLAASTDPKWRNNMMDGLANLVR